MNLNKAYKNGKLSTLTVLFLLSINQKDLKWQVISLDDDIVDLDSFYNRKDYVYAYALAEIKASAPANVLLAVGSDDGIKIWHNGKLVHDNWIPRGVNKDDDLVT